VSRNIIKIVIIITQCITALPLAPVRQHHHRRPRSRATTATAATFRG